MRRTVVFSMILILSGINCCTSPDPDTNPENTPIALSNGGSMGLGSIYAYTGETPQVKMVHEFTCNIPGTNPESLVSDNKGNLIGATSYGAKYDAGAIFRIMLQNNKLETLLVLPSNISIDKLFYLSNNLYFIGFDHETDKRNLYSYDPGSKEISPIINVPSINAIAINDELYFFDGSIHQWIPGQLTINKLTDVKEGEIRFLAAYNGGFVGLGIKIEHGPPDNPYINPVGSFLFSWQGGENTIETLGSWENSEVSNLLIYEDHATFTMGTVMCTYNLGTGSSVTQSLDQDINIENRLSNLTIVDDQIFGIASSENQKRLIAIGMDKPTLWLDEKSLVNPREIITVNGKLYIISFGDLVRYRGGIIEFDPIEHRSKLLVGFGVNAGESPLNGMVFLNNSFYGLTMRGGDYGIGSIFSLSHDLIDLQMVYSFSIDNGYEPIKIIPYKNALIGIAKRGGPEQVGTLFEYNPQTKSYRVLYEFTDKGCRYPKDLIIRNKKLYVICSGGNFARGDMLIFDTETEDYSHIKTDSWKNPSELLLYQNNIYILANPTKSKQNTWFSYNPDTDVFSKAMLSLPSGQSVLHKDVYYYMQSNNLIQWNPETDVTSILAEFESDDRYFHIQASGDHILISSTKSKVPEAATIYAYNTVSDELVTLLEDKEHEISPISVEASKALPATLTIIGQDIWVRSKPSTGEIVMKLNDEDVCILLEKGKYEEIREMKDFWYKISYQGQEGWVYGSQTNISQEKK